MSIANTGDNKWTGILVDDIKRYEEKIAALERENAELADEIGKLKVDRREYSQKWFHKGFEAGKHKNNSGCVCVINDETGKVESMCDFHKEVFEDIQAENAELRKRLAKLEAFWEQSRMADKMSFEHYEWKDTTSEK